MNNRLQQFLDLENLSPARLADMLGVQRSGVSHILSGRNKPGYDFIHKLLTKFPSLSADWFLTGKGKPYKEMNNFLSDGGQNAPSPHPENGANSNSGQWKNGEFSRGEKFVGQAGIQNGTPTFQGENLNRRDNIPVNKIDNSSTCRSRDFEANGNSFYESENKAESGVDNNQTVENKNYYNGIYPNSQIISIDNNSNKINKDSSDLIQENNNYDNLEKINSDIVNKNNNYQNTNSTDYSQDSPTTGASFIEMDSFFNGMEPYGRESTNSDFLEQNCKYGQNNPYNSDNVVNTAKNSASYRHENQINCTSKGLDREKRSVKRVIVFYNDGSFEELYPLGVGK